MSDEALRALRAEIDAVDDALLANFSRRAELASQVGHLKQGRAVYRPEREAQILRRMLGANPGPLPATAIRQLFTELMSACRALEQNLVIAYLGPPGTFSQSAASQHFGSAPEFMPVESIDAAFRAVEAGQAHYAVVPVENSAEGSVGRTLDLLLQTSLVCAGEVILRVHQNLMSRATDLAAISRIYSHAQSFGQCHEWLNAHAGGRERIVVASNAEAARRAADDPGSAAIAGTAAAELYGLTVLARNIEDDPNNATRFLVMGTQRAARAGHDKTSFACSAPNRPGAVHALLQPLAQEAVSMTKLESRPSPQGRWEYVFYIDVLGHVEDQDVARALANVESRATFFKVFGSYPRALVT